MAVIIHENFEERLDDYLEKSLRNYEAIAPPLPKKPEIVTIEEKKKKGKQQNGKR